MKKISILLVCLLAMSFVFVGCGGGGDDGGGGDRYDAIGFKIYVEKFKSVFTSETSASESSALTYITGDVNDLYAKIDSTSSDRIGFHSSTDSGSNITLDECSDFLQREGVETSMITSVQKTEILTKLEDDGYVVAYKGIGSSMIAVVAAKKN